MPVIQMNTIPGYEMIPLLEALNGPYQPSELTRAAASRQEAVRTLNDTGERNELHPIPMTVMVATSPHSYTPTKNDDEQTSLDSPVRQAHDIPRKSSSTKLSKSSSTDAKTPVTSDPEDEIHFSEAVETLPDLEEFGDTLDSTMLNSSRYEDKFSARCSSASKSKCNSTPKQEALEEKEMQLESIEGSPVHGTNVLMIAAIDEFSDEEDTSRTKRNISSGHRMLSGDRTTFVSDSAQSTPKRVFSGDSGIGSGPSGVQSSPEHSFRFGTKMVPTSLPSTPNCRLSNPGTANSTSTRSSGDSFTSSSSTKQLLPTTSTTGVHHL